MCKFLSDSVIGCIEHLVFFGNVLTWMFKNPSSVYSNIY